MNWGWEVEADHGPASIIGWDNSSLRSLSSLKSHVVNAAAVCGAADLEHWRESEPCALTWADAGWQESQKKCLTAFEGWRSVAMLLEPDALAASCWPSASGPRWHMRCRGGFGFFIRR